jgi:hypothetical protein
MNRREIFKKLFTGPAAGAGITPTADWQQPAAVLPEYLTASASLQFLHATDKERRAFRTGFRLLRREESDGLVLLSAGITETGQLFIDDKLSHNRIAENVLESSARLTLTLIPQDAGKQFIKLKAFDSFGNTLATLSTEKEMEGNPEIEVYADEEGFVQFTNQTFHYPNK